MTALEHAIPVYHFHEVHRRSINAEPERVWEVLPTPTLDQLPLTTPLVALRHLGRAPTPMRPLVTDGPTQLLDVDPPRYALSGVIARPRADKFRRDSVSGLPTRQRQWTSDATASTRLPCGSATTAPK